MPVIRTSDLTFRTADSGDWTKASVPEHVLNSIQRLFYMTPGSDIYNAEMGLDTIGRSRKAYREGARDTEYENNVMDQLSKYTDIVPTACVAYYKDGMLIISLSATYNSIEFRAQITSDPTTLTNQIIRV